MQGRVAILVQDIDALGGAEAQALLLARALRRRGLEVSVLTTGLPGARGADPDVLRLPLAAFEPLAALALRARRDLRALYCVGVTLGVLGARVGRVLGVEVVVKLAGAGPPGDLATLLRLPPRARAGALEALRATTVVCMTDDLEAEARAAGLPRRARIPNGVDLDAVAAAPPSRPLGGAPTVLFAGRLSHEKGLDVLLDAFAAVRAARPDARLLVAGEGPERAELEARGRAAAGDAAVFLGRRDDVPGLLRGATVVALPSRSDGLSNVLLEALAAGAAVVATATPSAREVAGGAALVVPPDELAPALVRALGDGDLRARLGAAAQARARAFGIEAVADAYLALFGGLPPPRRPGPMRFAARFARARAADARRLLSRW